MSKITLDALDTATEPEHYSKSVMVQFASPEHGWFYAVFNGWSHHGRGADVFISSGMLVYSPDAHPFGWGNYEYHIGLHVTETRGFTPDPADDRSLSHVDRYKGSVGTVPASDRDRDKIIAYLAGHVAAYVKAHPDILTRAVVRQTDTHLDRLAKEITDTEAHLSDLKTERAQVTRLQRAAFSDLGDNWPGRL